MILLIYINYMSAASVGSLRHSHTDSDKVDTEQLNEVEAVNLLFLFPVSSLSSLLSPSEHSLPPSLSPPLSFSFPVIRIETSRQLFSTSTELHSFLKRDASLSISACID